MRELNLGNAYPKQIQFFLASGRYIAYGGARGGGKSWAARVKVVLLALNYGGIQMLLLRRTLPELRENHVVALVKLLKGVARYKESTREFIFPNQSRLKLGYCDTEKDVLQYQGQAYDVIIMEEATQFTEFQYQTLTESNRSSGMCAEKFSPRMYLTCNPGGVGHAWVKRLFIDKDYIGSERAEDYAFIPAKVYDNKHLMEKDPEYVRVLENISDPARRAAMLDGDWDIFIG
ncbi:MAG: phage terminase large subunit, partial [Christensenella sp.]